MGWGIRGGQVLRDLFTLVEQIPRIEQDVFIFSIAGKPYEKFDQPLKELLLKKGCRIVDEFQCPGKAGVQITW